MQHEPCALLCNANCAMDFIAAHAILAIADHPDRGHPLVERDRRIFKNRADLDCELLLASVAEPELTSLHKRIALRTATRA